MKITVCYEKKDIIELVLEALRKQGLKPVDADRVVYKGALSVSMDIDIDATPPKKSEPVEDVKEEPENEEDVDVDIDKILRESANIRKKDDKKKPRVERVMGANESLDFPEEGKG